MIYFKLKTAASLPRCPYVDKPCVGDACLAWRQRVDILENSESIIYTDQGYCAAIYKESI